MKSFFPSKRAGQMEFSGTTSDGGESYSETSDRNMPGLAGGMASLHNYARQGKLWETKGLSINKSYILFT